MNVFIREMKANGKSLVIWCLGALFLVAGGMAKFAGYSSAGQSVNDLMRQMPRAMQSIVGLGAIDLSTALGFFSMLYLYLLIMAGVHAALLGANIIAKEEEYKTAEFLFTKPVSRRRVMAEKVMAGLVNVIILNAATWVSSQVLLGYYSRDVYVAGGVKLLMGGMMLFQILFLAMGAAMAAIKKRSRDAASASAALLLGAFILSVMIDIDRRLSFLRYLTPFRYFEAAGTLSRGGLSGVYVTISAVATLLLLSAGFAVYARRDMNI